VNHPDPLTLENLEIFEQKLVSLQHKVRDLKQVLNLDTASPSEWADLQAQMTDLENRMHDYLSELNQPPMAFWQVVRFGGIGILLGIALEKWLG
jgi:hypothetical protein